MAKGPRGLTHFSNTELVRRLQSMLMNAADGRRSVSDDRQYSQIRRALIKRGVGLPKSVSLHPSADSYNAELKGMSSRDARSEFVRQDFETVLQRLEDHEGPQPPDSDPSSWTGIENPAVKLRAVRELLPIAQVSVEVMIEELSRLGPNGGPLMDEREDAIRHLRDLHRTLGELLDAAESGHLEDGLGQGLAAEAVRYAKRFSRSVDSDPMPYAASALILGLFSVCGFPEAGAYLGGLAVSVRKSAEK